MSDAHSVVIEAELREAGRTSPYQSRGTVTDERQHRRHVLEYMARRGYCAAWIGRPGDEVAVRAKDGSASYHVDVLAGGPEFKVWAGWQARCSPSGV